MSYFVLKFCRGIILLIFVEFELELYTFDILIIILNFTESHN